MTVSYTHLKYNGEYVIKNENNDEKDMLKLLYQSLRALESPAYKNELVRAVFELSLIHI